MTETPRVLYQSFGPPENKDYLDRLQRTVAVAGETFGVRVEIAALTRTLLTQKQHRAFHLAAGAHLLEQVYASQAQGYAAAIVGNIQDPALYECRQVCRIPVVGLLDSALAVSRAFGTSVGLITTSALTIPLLRERVRQYGDDARAVSWRTIEIKPPELLAAFTNAERGNDVWQRFVSAARRAASDGAEQLVPASGMLASYLCARAGDTAGWDVGAGAPVLNPVFTAVAHAASAAGLARAGLPISRTGTYSSPSPEALKEFFRT
ncbi:MAG: hypothetical protein KGN00_07580 [Chloroflexota bacterium]|nr:hypothetical protein [Chloroflexota bacterium]